MVQLIRILLVFWAAFPLTQVDGSSRVLVVGVDWFSYDGTSVLVCIYVCVPYVCVHLNVVDEGNMCGLLVWSGK